jgi:hypothetical protein
MTAPNTFNSSPFSSLFPFFDSSPLFCHTVFLNKKPLLFSLGIDKVERKSGYES